MVSMEENELCNGIKMILRNMANYIDNHTDPPDMRAVRKDFRRNGWCEDDDESKENSLTTFSPITSPLPFAPISPTAHLPTFQRHILCASTKNNKPKRQAINCVFCMNNKEPEHVYASHAVRDGLGRVVCPKLRNYTCPWCGATGDRAHTVRYCDQKPVYTMQETKVASVLPKSVPSLTGRSAMQPRYGVRM